MESFRRACRETEDTLEELLTFEAKLLTLAEEEERGLLLLERRRISQEGSADEANDAVEDDMRSCNDADASDV